eukprot:Clim_evm81s33 gene=Clim_evmTU81s33
MHFNIKNIVLALTAVPACTTIVAGAPLSETIVAGAPLSETIVAGAPVSENFALVSEILAHRSEDLAHRSEDLANAMTSVDSTDPGQLQQLIQLSREMQKYDENLSVWTP